MSKTILTVPNGMTLFRFLLTAPLAYCLLAEQFVWAFVITVVFYFIDYMDGIVARKLDQCTDFGRNFDAVSDITFAAVLILWAMNYSSIATIIWIVFVINILIMAGIILFFIRKIKIWPKLKRKKYNSIVFIIFQLLMILDFQNIWASVVYWLIMAFFVFRNIDIYLQLRKINIAEQKQ
jgi:cardiolipin synthase